MYSDEDGIASKYSQKVYHVRMRVLVSAVSVLSGLGFAAVLLGDGPPETIPYPNCPRCMALPDFNKILWLVLLLHNLSLYWTNGPVATYAAGLRGSLLSSVLVVSLLVTSIYDDNISPSALSSFSTQLGAASFLAILQTLFPRRPELFTPEGKPVDLENSVSAFEKYSMRWCTTAISLAGGHVALDRFPVLDYRTRSKTQQLLVMASSGTTLWNRILAERYLGFAKQWVLMLARSVITFGSPYCVMRLLSSLEKDNAQIRDAWVWLFGIGAFSICQTVIHYHLVWIQWSEMGIPIRAQLIMSIFQKALRVKDSKDPRTSDSKPDLNKPEAISLVSSDTRSFSKFTAVNYIIPASFIRFFFAVLFLIRLLGWQSAAVTMSVTMLSLPVHTYVVKQERAAQKNLTAARDRKTKAITEALHSLREIKFSAMEAQWEERIEVLRQEEIKYLQKSFIAGNIKSVWSVAAPFLVAAASICTYAYTKNTISPSVIFPMAEVLPHLQGTLGFVPVALSDYLSARSNAKRMETYLRRSEQKTILEPSQSGEISFQNASIAWPSDETDRETSPDKQTGPYNRFHLHDITLRFPIGELSLIHGPTGSGKSLLLAAMLGEVDLLAGRIVAPSAAHGQPVAFVSQTVWLQNDTIRNNILFGSPLNEERYQMVLKACALLPDLAVLTKGDETQIGLRGVKLSGGQRARVSLGRALYSNARTIILDDIFAALDTHVAKEVFNAITGKLCDGRTRILVTHRVSLCSAKAKYLVRVENNSIGYAGSPDTAEEVLGVAERESVPEPPLPVKTELKVVDGVKKMNKVRVIKGRSDLALYRSYCDAAGGPWFTLIYFSGMVFKQLLGSVTSWLLGHVKSVRPSLAADAHRKLSRSMTDGDTELKRHLYPYLSASLLAVAFEFVFNGYTHAASLRASRMLFRKITTKVLRMPLLWLDTTSMGEMLKRFTVDTRMIDENVLMNFSEFADCILKMIVILCVGLYMSKYTCFLALTLSFWSARVSRLYIRARTTVKRADAGPTGDILENFTSVTSGISTIRAFGATGYFIEQMHQSIDKLSTARRHFWIFNRWLGLQMSFIGILFSVGTGVILLSSDTVIDPSVVGFSLTFAMGLSQTLFNAVNSFGTLETYMDAAGAIVACSNLEAESQDGIEVAADWPSNGEVQVEGLNLAYAPELPLVLKNISFTIEGGKRIGIVGRTGAGKSSLALSFLRLIEPRSGSIHIDGTDISQMKVRTLRSKIGFIPQDPVLFSGTIRSNLDYFSQVSEQEIKDALRSVRLLADQGDNKNGLFTLDSPISAGGANLSQGQKQLLCLARILLKKQKIVILDEATSAVDNKTDYLIQETIRSLKDRTLIVVAHRLRTIASFDQVVVMSDGKIIEFGRPAKLLKAKGLFYELVQDSEDAAFLTNAILAEPS